MEKDIVNDQIKAFWNVRSETFDEAHKNEDKERWFVYFQDLLGEPDGQKVLDIGTGTGFLAQMAARLGFEAVGIDIAEQMLKIAEKKAKQDGLEISYQLADLHALPFEAESFDYIVNSRVLWTLTQPEEAIREWKRVLKPGGEILSFVRLKDDMCIHTTPGIYGEEVYEALPLKQSHAQELIRICRDNGFLKTDLVKLPGIAKDAQEYGEWYVLRSVRENYEQELAVSAIAGFWDRRSSTYEEAHELTSIEYWKKYLQQLVGDDKKTRIVDVATGTGMIANLLGEMGYTDVTGMDISEGMMKLARAHAKEKNTGVTFTYGNALDLPLQESSTDVLLNCRLLWTLVEPEKAVQEWIRVVKPGGAVISLHEMTEEQRSDGEDHVWRYFLYGKNADPYMMLNNATKSEYVALFENSGLERVQLLHMKGCHSHENTYDNWYALIGYKKEEK